MVRFRTESRAEELWIPQNTVALDNQQYVTGNFGRLGRISTIAFVRQKGAENDLANKASLLQMINVAEDGFKITAAPINEDGADNTIITFPERCKLTQDERGNTVCEFFTALNLFYKLDNVVIDGDRVDYFKTVRKGVEQLSDGEIRNMLTNPSKTSFDGSPFNAVSLIGGKGDSIDILLFSMFSDDKSIVENGEEIDKEADALEEEWTTFLLEDSPRLEGRSIDWYVESQWSQSDSLSDALSGDLPLLSSGFVLLAIYVIFFLGDFHAIRSHMLLALAALLTTGLALGSGFGISSATGMFYGPVHQILPLLIIGIGIDDCFHVTRAADDTNRKYMGQGKPVPLRMAIALSQSGSAITVTSFTNVLVFLLSAISRLPALRFFALWAAFGIFFAWFFAITFFTACLSLDLRRQDAKRRDCLPCCKPVQEVKELNWFKRPAGGFSRFFGNKFGPLIMRPVVRIVILLAFVVWFAVCCYGTSQLYLKFKFSFFYPSGSAQREYQDQIDEYFQLGDATRVYVRDRDLSSAENQKKLLELCDPETGVIASDKWVQDNTVSCWYTEFRKFAGVSGNEVVPQGQFVQKVKDFTAQGTSGQRFETELVFNGDKNIYDGCRFRAQYIYRDSNDEEIEALKSLRASADSVGFGDAGPKGNSAAFPYTFLDTFTEQYDALPGEIGISLGLASAAVAIVCMVLVGHPIVALVSVLVVGMIIIDVLGLTYFSGYNLNSVSVITLVLCTGISVDFVVHITRSFLEQVGSRSERAIKSLETMGPPVFYAGFSTLLAIIVLSGARSYIFRVIFFGFFFLITMGFLHGLILGPILLSLVGPPSFYANEEEKEQAERKLEERAMGEKALEEKEDEGENDDSV